jgi:hypothetical protein
MTLSHCRLALGVLLCGATAQAATNNFIVPGFRGQPNSENAYWEVFTVPYGPPGNTADQPGSTAGAILTQTASPSAFTTGSGNLYDPVAITAFRLTDATPFALGTVVLQVRSLGSELDYDAVRLTYIDGFGAHSLEPDLQWELDRGTILGASVSALWQWDLQGLNVTDYSLSFASADPSLSLDAVTIDTWDQFMVVPEPSSLAILFLGALVLLSRARHEK